MESAMDIVTTPTEQRKQRARAWFEQVRDDICAALERIEDEARPRSTRARPPVSCARRGSAPTTAASRAAAA